MFPCILDKERRGENRSQGETEIDTKQKKEVKRVAPVIESGKKFQQRKLFTPTKRVKGDRGTAELGANTVL